MQGPSEEARHMEVRLPVNGRERCPGCKSPNETGGSSRIILANGETLLRQEGSSCAPLKREEQKTQKAKSHQNTCTPPPVSFWDLQQRSGHDDHENAIEDQGQAHYLGNALSSWKHFFCKDQHGKHCHHCDIHDAQGEEEYKEQPVRSQAIDAVLKAHTKGASVAVTPGTTDEIQRRAAFCQADALEGSELIEPG